MTNDNYADDDDAGNDGGGDDDDDDDNDDDDDDDGDGGNSVDHGHDVEDGADTLIRTLASYRPEQSSSLEQPSMPLEWAVFSCLK